MLVTGWWQWRRICISTWVYVRHHIKMVNKLKLKRQRKQEDLRLLRILKNVWVDFRLSDSPSRGRETLRWHLCITWEKSKLKLHAPQKQGIPISPGPEWLWNTQKSPLELLTSSSCTFCSLVGSSLSTPTHILEWSPFPVVIPSWEKGGFNGPTAYIRHSWKRPI